MAVVSCPVSVQAQARPDAVALELADRKLSYLELHELADSTALGLRTQGVRPGHIIATLAGNNLEMILLAIACWRSGFIWAPCNPRWRKPVLEQQLQRLQPNWLWTASDFSDPGAGSLYIRGGQNLSFDLHNLGPGDNRHLGVSDGLDAERVMNLIQTSGSSGSPKFVAQCLRNHLQSAASSSRIIPLGVDDGWLLVLPLYHIAGLAVLFRCFLAGARVVLSGQDEQWLPGIRKSRITHVSLVNAQFFDLLAELPAGSHGIKAVLLGGSAISRELIQRANDKGLPCFSSYGMTETSSQIYTVNHQRNKYAQSLAPSGQLLSCIEVRFDHRQQILVRGEALALGYWQDRAVVDFRDSEGWFATGDIGEYRQGVLRITGRQDNMFSCGGENLQAEVIEASLCQHPAVRQALVVPVDDLKWGKIPVAFIKWCNTEPVKNFDRWLKMNINSLQRPRWLLSWDLVEMKNNKTDRRACVRIANKIAKEGLQG